ncbi:hypothetical protein TTHERM_00123970 (macronuclear) [Tetrahymena thermophila SB210]|uniref:Transmembrane protein n=1 Tax=Tetrahymena thermophila (strain SB210) TaxID=312017 RepID=Q22YM4_TETTS|nr:hypothetical protein TTHERM_00123970 [Tetrahymena thermophila SB210]EAR90647.1 hypothetical protein TTHERM_00123970 [Tetrahymena thermophila SB210]|eukprot:XP_001010892.1 hypothetical protein TTHERM_00123970 [Tetrahymena thermophila SB210]
MKYNTNSKTKLFILFAVSAISITVAANNDTCSSHLAFAKARSILTYVLNSDSQGKQKNDVLQKQFQNANPTNKTKEELGVCFQYANQNTCCDQNIVKLIDQAALLKVKPLQQSKSAFQKLISVYIAQVNKNCTSNVLPSSPLNFDDIFKNSTLKILQSNRTAQANCKINFAKAISSFTRGALCSICAGVEKVNDYFNDQGQLKISQSSVNIFQQQTDQAISCFSSFLTASNIEIIVKELNAAYIKNNNICGQNVLTNIKAIFANSKVLNNDGKGGKICKGTTVFGDNSACEKVLQGDSNLEYNNLRFLRFDDQDMNRLLQSVEDSVVDPNGVNIYITSNNDNQIDENGNGIMANFDGINTNFGLNKTIGALFGLIYFLF